MTQTRALIRCNRALVPTELDQQKWSYRRELGSVGPSPTLTLRVQSLAGTVISSINSHAADLVRIASFIYGADQSVSRGGIADVYGEDWRRHMALCIPVTEPGFWMQESVRSQITEVLTFLTDDDWEFHFCEADGETQQISLSLEDSHTAGLSRFGHLVLRRSRQPVHKGRSSCPSSPKTCPDQSSSISTTRLSTATPLRTSSRSNLAIGHSHISASGSTERVRTRRTPVSVRGHSSLRAWVPPLQPNLASRISSSATTGS